MPIYEYKCSQCGYQFEVMQKFSDDPLNTCPTCKGELKKIISNTSFVLKGNGWYADGYASSSNKTLKEGKSAGIKPIEKKPAGATKGRANT